MTRIEELQNQLIAAREAYYNGEPIMRDDEYDAIEDELLQLDPENALLAGIGEDESDGFPKAKHNILMGSQSKCNTVEQISKKLESFSSKGKVAFLVEDKCDGISLEMNYKDGNLVSCITRGNGYIGDDITVNAKKMAGIPHKLKDSFTLSVRGEILLFHDDKDKYFPDLKNCRNSASGIAKNKEGEGCEHLTVVSYDVQGDSPELFTKETNKVQFLKDNGFNVTNMKLLLADCTTRESREKSANEMYQVMLELSSNEERPYDTDGIVVKTNNVDWDDQRNNLHPTTQWAIKPPAEHRQSKLLDIEWSMKNGTLTPVAVFEPIEIDGATIQRATLNNVRYIENLKIEIGDTLEIIRANLVIPRVVGNITKGTSII